MEDFDKEIALAKVEYDISVYSANILDEKRKHLEARKNLALIERKISELNTKLEEAKRKKDEIL